MREERTKLPPSSSVCLIPESSPSRLFVISAVPLVSILGLWRASVTSVGSVFPMWFVFDRGEEPIHIGNSCLYCMFQVANVNSGCGIFIQVLNVWLVLFVAVVYHKANVKCFLY